MKRRDFLKTSPLAASFSLGKIPVWASNMFEIGEGQDDTVLVVIQLFGGNDGLNTIIPADNDAYYSKFRKKTSVPKAKLSRIGSSSSYLNPALKLGTNNGLEGLYKEGKLAIIQGIGYPNNSLSHFRSTDIWLSGTVPADDTQRLETGWMGRYLEVKSLSSEHPPCLNIGNETSLLFQTVNSNRSLSIADPNEFYESGKGVLSGEALQTGNTKYAAEYNYLIDLGIKSNKYSIIVKQAFDKGKNTKEFAKGKLSDELKLVARLISGGLKTKVYMVSLDGFDTHSNQGSLDGKHAELLQQISEAISFFMEDLKTQKLTSKIVGLTVSEFGRRPTENESSGTDHGAAGVMFMFGDAVKGNLYGKPFDFSNLDKNQDFPFQYDYRAVYDEVLTKWLPTRSNLATEVLGKSFTHIEGGLIRSGGSQFILSTPEPVKTIAYPNPSINGMLQLKMQLLENTEISISQYSSSGRNLTMIEHIPFPMGNHKIPVQLIGGPGVYVLQVLKNKQKETIKVIWA
jgi:uncharacterized protein (DUF1501 family)